MHVEWTGAALDRLADIYVAAAVADRDEIEATTRRINATLAADPDVLGESRSGRSRVWFEYPLMVCFEHLHCLIRRSALSFGRAIILSDLRCHRGAHDVFFLLRGL